MLQTIIGFQITKLKNSVLSVSLWFKYILWVDILVHGVLLLFLGDHVVDVPD